MASRDVVVLQSFILGSVKLGRCDRCKAMVQVEDMQEHEAWHEAIQETVNRLEGI